MRNILAFWFRGPARVTQEHLEFPYELALVNLEPRKAARVCINERSANRF
jgi:hypothetical protein